MSISVVKITTFETEMEAKVLKIQESSKKEVKMSKKEKENLMIRIENEMKEAAKNLDFERAMELRNLLFEMKSE